MRSCHPEPGYSIDWLALVARVKADDPEGVGELRRVFLSGIRFFLRRRLGLDQLEARVEEAFAMLVGTIKTEDFREHEPLAGLVRRIVLRQITAYSGATAPRDRPAALPLKTVPLMARMLGGMSLRYQEALTRFYCHEQTEERICSELRLTGRQFHFIKARAKDTFAKVLAGQRAHGDASQRELNTGGLATAGPSVMAREPG